jgi:hypothetical protein
MRKPTQKQIKAALDDIGQAKDDLEEARADYPQNTPERRLIETAFWMLDRIEANLRLQQIQTAVDKLDADSKSLSLIADDIKKSVVALASIADDIATVATAVQTIVNVIQSAATL